MDFLITTAVAFSFCLIEGIPAQEKTVRYDEATDELSVNVVLVTGGLIGLILLCMGIFVCLLFCKRSDKETKITHVRCEEDWLCKHKPVILVHKRIGSGMVSDTTGVQTEHWDTDSGVLSPPPKPLPVPVVERKIPEPKMPKGVWLPHSHGVRKELVKTSTK